MVFNYTISAEQQEAVVAQRVIRSTLLALARSYGPRVWGRMGGYFRWLDTGGAGRRPKQRILLVRA